MDDAPRIWVLADGRAGNRAQALGVAERLGIPFETKEIRYTAWAKLPNALRGKSLLGLTHKSKKRIQKPWPDVVIAAGRRAAPVARYIKKQNPKTRLVQLMWPDAGEKDFDCIVLPSHDRDHKEAGNILRVLGAPHRVTEIELEKARMDWEDRFRGLPKPRVALLVGGSSKHGQFTNADYQRLGALTASLALGQNGSVLVTTSRRTGSEAEATLKSHIADQPHHFHGWQDSKQEENPYMAYLALADAVVVTADSISMCSEACSTGKPVLVFEPNNLSAKHKRFAAILIGSGYAFPLEEDFVGELRAPLKQGALDSAATIAKHIRETLLPKG